jgi:hypothetical protein
LLVWHRLRGRRVHARRPAFVGSGVMAAGVLMLWLTCPQSDGCPRPAQARQPADRFALALLTRGPKAAAAEMWSGTVSAARANGIVREGQFGTGSSCEVFPIPAIPGFPSVEDEMCVVYGLPSGIPLPESITGDLIVYVGCRSDSWQVVGFG